jgi:CDP-paratose synthetase
VTGPSPHTILVTGGTGFLGSHLTRRLAREGNSVIALLRPTSDTRRIADVLERISIRRTDDPDWETIFRDRRIDIILHCATSYGRREPDPVSLLEANLFLPLRLLEMGKKHGVRVFINTDTILDKRVNHYSLSKSQFREWLRNYARDLVCVNIAIEHFYGPGDDESKFVSFIVASILKQVDRIELTRGEQKRDFIFIDDVVDAFMRVIAHSPGREKGYYPFEIGTGRTLDVRTFVTLAREIAGNRRTILDFGAIPYRDNEVMETRVDTGAIRALGWEPRITVQEGLRRLITHGKGRPDP